jgi:invasion protein IalB
MLSRPPRLAAAALLALAPLAAAAQETTSDDQQPQAPAPQAQENAPAAEAPAEQPQIREEAVHDDWTVYCFETRDLCFMRQVGQYQGQDIIEVRLVRREPQQTQRGTVEAVLEVRTPINVLLKPGVSLTIDQGETQQAMYHVCAPQGCVLQEGLPNALVNQFKRGITASFGIVPLSQGEPQRIEIPISLKGFTAAYESLEP